MSDSRPLSDRLLSLLQAGHIRLSDARAMIDAAPPDGRVPGWIVEDLRSALAAADAAIAPEKP